MKFPFFLNGDSKPISCSVLVVGVLVKFGKLL